MGRRPLRLSRAQWDALIIFGVAVILLIASISIQAFEYVVVFSETHEGMEIDELLTVMMVMPVAMGIFGYRRLREAHDELRKRREAEEQAQSLALHDPLTGLPNRRNAESELAKAIAGASASPVVVMMVDLNRFKAINDLHGHAVGDEVLLAAGNRLRETCGAQAFVARLGGDEFAVILRNPPEGAALVELLDTISQRFSEPIQLPHGRSVVGASIGVTCVGDSRLTADEVLNHADAAMYRCKERGRNGFAFFEQGMEFTARQRAEIEAGLRLAIAKSRIEPFFQPIVSLANRRITGHEVLARWRLDDGTVRKPDEFIAIAEDSGLIGDVYYCVLMKAALAARDWPKAWRFSINIAPIQFEDEWLVERTLKILLAAGLSPTRLDIEITESALVTNVDRARHVISKFKSQGINIVLDDFGTGYSSLRHLSELEFDRLKVDRSFVTNLTSDKTSQTIVRTITSMAHNLGLAVTVEGIESEENEADVRELGCDMGQGYLYGRPQDERATLAIAKEYLAKGMKAKKSARGSEAA